MQSTAREAFGYDYAPLTVQDSYNWQNESKEAEEYLNTVSDVKDAYRIRTGKKGPDTLN